MNDFELWKMKMKAILVKDERKLPQCMKYEEKKDLLKKASSSLIFRLRDKVQWEMVKKTTRVDVLKKVEELYMSKSIPNRNFLK